MQGLVFAASSKKNCECYQSIIKLPSFPYIPDFSAISIAGSSNDQYEAANMTPPANPRLASNSFL